MRERSEIEATVREVLDEAKVIAVLGAHVRPEKPAFYVPDYLHDQGYEILPVNPVFAGREQWGATFVGRLDELSRPVDVIDVFRRAEWLPGHVEEILALDPLPRWVWLQLGIRHDAVASRLRERGIAVVQDRCLLADHRALGGRGRR